ncbi:HMG domain-containing protein 3 [Merluccius polli]|uniref:HMG domain-containing protein 3 n=1 Tax=Merluccius polli TaxID=89951 RepID=A0AA47NXB6_MERPO|nr:HMG domain-containing protein 3 [Merluccius polli]
MLPAKLPPEVMHAMAHEWHLIPTETHCSLCQCGLSEPVQITSKARLVTYTGVIEGFSTYYRVCQCGQYYRYQEWTAGLHNFDFHLLSLHMCMILRNSLQTHHAVSRVIEVLESTTSQTFPSKARILHSYMHFEALTSNDYTYSCINCGYHPAVVVMDLHKMAVFNMPINTISIPASEIPDPPPEYDGNVNITDFWTIVTSEVVCLLRMRTLFWCHPPITSGPLRSAPTPGEVTVFSTPNTKKFMPLDRHLRLQNYKSQERLEDTLTSLKVDVVRRLCQQCGLDSAGSKRDLVLRLRHEMRNRSTYDKVFQKVWGASGGWAVITCPCGIVYSVKFLMRGESPRDYADCLLSFRHFPNITIYDFARGLATHTNLREPERSTFRPHEGRLEEPTEENIKLGLDGHLKVNLPWLKRRRDSAEPDCHPVTGSAEHYALYDVFHQKNTKDKSRQFCGILLVPTRIDEPHGTPAGNLLKSFALLSEFENFIFSY